MIQRLNRQRVWIALAFILVIAAFFRFYALDGQSFWADEGNSVALAARSGSEIITAAAADIHPPAYYLLLRVWGQAFGLDENGARSFSALAGIVLVGLIFLLGRRLRNSLTGLVAAALAAVNPFLVYYSQEARMYEILALYAALAGFGLLLWITPPARRKLGGTLYALAAILGMYTHYAFPIHLLALNVVWLLWLWRNVRAQNLEAAAPRSRIGRVEVAPWLGLNVIVLLLYLPWTPTAFQQLTTWPGPAAQLSLFEALDQAVRLFLCGPIGCAEGSALLAVGAVLFLILVVIALLPRWPTAGSWLESILPLLWMLAPLAAMLAFGIFSPVFFKFLIIAAPAFLLLVGVGVDRLASLTIRASGDEDTGSTLTPIFRPSLAALLILALILPAFIALDRYYNDPTVARDDYRSIAAYLKAVANANDAVILNAPGQIDVFSQYDHGEAAVYPLPTSRPLEPDSTAAELDQVIADNNRIYAIYWATEQSDPKGVIETYLAEHAFKAWDSWVGNLRFVAYNAEPPPQAVPYPQPPQFGRNITLVARGLVEGDPIPPGAIASVLLQWSTAAVIDSRYKVSLQVLDTDNQVIAQVDSEPVGGLRPTTSWQPHEIIDDAYGLPIPLGAPPGDYPLMLVMYDAETGDRLPIQTPEEITDMLHIGDVTVVLPTQAPPAAILPVRYHAHDRVGDVIFLGHDRNKLGYDHAPDTPLEPGDLLHLTTYWQAVAPLDGDYLFDLQLDNTALGRFPLTGSGYPTSQWEAGFPWRGETTVLLPAELATGEKHFLTAQLIGPDGAAVGKPIALYPPLIY